MKIQIEELNGKSAFSYCRKIYHTCGTVEQPLEVYRGETLSYTISSIKWGAGTKLIESDKHGFILKKYGKNDY